MLRKLCYVRGTYIHLIRCLRCPAHYPSICPRGSFKISSGSLISRLVSSDVTSEHRYSQHSTDSTMARTTGTIGEAAGDLHSPRRSYQVVVAATRDMGIGKDGKLPWKLPCDLKFFKELTSAVDDPAKRNAVLMGRRTWESIPQQFRPLPGRFNIVLTRSRNVVVESDRDVVLCGTIDSALELLSSSPYRSTIENVYVIGGGELLREALNSHQCDAIHITEIETDIGCDTFVPPINSSMFKPWYSSSPVVENGIRYSFVTYVLVRNSSMESQQRGNGDELSDSTSDFELFGVKSFSFLPKMIFRKHEEFAYLKLVEEILTSGIRKVDRTGHGLLSKFGLQMRFNLRKTFPLLTTERLHWQGIVEEFLQFISGSNTVKLTDVVNKIISCPDDRRIILSSYSPLSDLKLVLPSHHVVAQFHVSNGELSCLTYQESADVALDLPYSIASGALLTRTITHLCGLHPGDLILAIGDAYVSDSHVGPLKEQLDRQPRPFPSLKIAAERKDVGSITAADFKLMDYHPLPLRQPTQWR